MTMQSELRACLLPIVTGGVHFAVLPLGAVPVESSPDRSGWSAIVLPVDIATPNNTICGASDLEDHRMQIDLYSPSYGGILTLRKQVFTAVEAQFPLSVRINDLADYDADLRLHRRVIEYSISAE